MRTNKYAELEKALVDICRTSNTPVYMEYWDQIFTNFFDACRGPFFRLLDVEMDELQDWTAEEIKSTIYEDMPDDFLSNFLRNEINDVSIEFDAVDDYDCDTCGTSYTNIKVNVGDEQLWKVSASFGCYGGDNFSGSKEDVIQGVNGLLKDLFPNPNSDIKYRIKPFKQELKDLKKTLP